MTKELKNAIATYRYIRPRSCYGSPPGSNEPVEFNGEQEAMKILTEIYNQCAGPDNTMAIVHMRREDIWEPPEGESFAIEINNATGDENEYAVWVVFEGERKPGPVTCKRCGYKLGNPAELDGTFGGLCSTCIAYGPE